MTRIDPTELGGVSLVLGFLLVLVVLYQDPATDVADLTGGLQPALYFLVLPLLGVIAGVYAHFEGPYSGVPEFVFGSYLGVFGLAITLRSLLSPAPAGLALVVGLVLSALAVVSLVASLVRVAAFFRIELPGPSTE